MDYGGRGERGIFGRNIPIAGWKQIAYQVRGFQIEGPSWILNEKFDIEAQAESEVSGAVLLQMLQSLLADRFQLRLHRETRDIPAYILGVNRGGLKMKASRDQTLWAGDFPNGSTDGMETAGGGPTELAPGRFAGEAIPLNLLIRLLADQVGRPVLNGTGSMARYDMDLRYAPGSGQAPLFDPNLVDTGAPSLFTALQEQLGLQLESTRAPGEVLVIDAIERPSEN